jgi:hypothetical protein
MARSLGLSDDLAAYVQEVGTRLTPEQHALREATRGMRGAGMQIGPDQGHTESRRPRLVRGRRDVV